MFIAETSDTDFGRALRAARVGAGLSLRVMASKVGIHYSHLARAEAGQRRLSPEVVARIETVIAESRAA